MKLEIKIMTALSILLSESLNMELKRRVISFGLYIRKITVAAIWMMGWVSGENQVTDKTIR